MKFKEYINEGQRVDAPATQSLIGLTINEKLITSNTMNMRWEGDFKCNNRKLTSLKGAPKEVSGDFLCFNNELKSLKYAPIKVHGGFYCSSNNLRTLEGLSPTIMMGINCSGNKLTSLNGAPTRTGGNFNCSSNLLNTLQHGPQTVVGSFNCSHNGLKSLEHSPKIIANEGFYCYNNKLTNLKDIHKMITRITGDFNCTDNEITSHVLGLLLIPGITDITSDDGWDNILNKYLGKGRAGLIECQNELIDKGFEEFAQL